MKVGAIERLRRALSARKFDTKYLHQFLRNRIEIDKSANMRGLRVSDLSLPTTNSVISLPEEWTTVPSCGSLFGIPFLAKDNYCVTSPDPTTCASRALFNYSPPYNASVS